MAVKEGWKGRFYEDFEVGDVYEHPLGKTVTTRNNVWFTLLTQNTAPLRFVHQQAPREAAGACQGIVGLRSSQYSSRPEE